MSKLPIVIAVLALLPASSEAAPACGPAKAVNAFLVSQGKKPAFRGFSDNGNLIRIWSGSSGWSITANLPSGVACLIASGRTLERIEPAKKSRSKRK